MDNGQRVETVEVEGQARVGPAIYQETKNQEEIAIPSPQTPATFHSRSASTLSSTCLVSSDHYLTLNIDPMYAIQVQHLQTHISIPLSLGQMMPSS